MENFKKAKVILLPSNKKAKLYLDDKGIYSKNRVDDSILRHNLYIICDDEIKEGDYFLADNRISSTHNNGKPNWAVCKCTEVKNTWIYCNEIPDEGHNEDWTKKIIATIDTSLEIDSDKLDSIGCVTKCKIQLPQPSQQFVKGFIVLYNEGNTIEDVVVEYKLTIQHNGRINNETRMWENLKINSDNTITIKTVKNNNYSREEVEKLIREAYDTGYHTCQHNHTGRCKSISVNEFIEENL